MNVTRNIKSLKRTAMSRRRTVIFDSDSGDTGRLCQGTTATDLLGVRAKPAIDAGIDTYICTTGMTGFGVCRHDSRVASLQRTREGHLSENKAADFARERTDYLRYWGHISRYWGHISRFKISIASLHTLSSFLLTAIWRSKRHSRSLTAA